MPGAFAESALAAIEFPAALELVKDYAATDLGKARVLSLLPGSDVEVITRELELVSQLAARLAEGEDAEPVSCPDPSGALARLGLAGGVLEGAELVRIRSLLAAARLTALKLKRLSRSAPLVGGLVAPPHPPEHEQELSRALDDEGRLVDSASRQLAGIRRDLVESRLRLVRSLERILRSLPAAQRPADAAVTVRSGRYVVPVRSGGRSRVNGIVHDESSTHATLFIEPAETVEEGNRLRRLEAEEARETQRILRQLTDRLRPQAEQLRASLEMLVAHDCAYARARFALARGASRPALAAPGGRFAVVAGAHPLLFRDGGSVVRFDLVLQPGETVVVVSGPNTGGKTVLLKAVGLLAALAQSGIIPPAGPGTTLPLFTTLYADIGDRQSIRESLSTFSAHLTALRQVLDGADRSSLVLLDEVGTGTDPAEGAALASAALRALARRGCITLASTHLGALKELAGREPGVVNASLEFDAASLAPTFRFTKGVPGRSYGLAIARRLGLDESVLAQAEAGVPDDQLRLEAALSAVEARRRELECWAAELAGRQAELAGRSEDLARQAGDLERLSADVARREKALERAVKSARRDALLAARVEVERALELARDGKAKEARRALEAAIHDLSRSGDESESAPGGEPALAGPPASLMPGLRVRIRTLGLVGEVESVRGEEVAVRVRGRRLRVRARDLAFA